ncbi:glycine-rich cell wall structural protein-like [Bactrocera tryoni]|uniref:glycine-rich cell wall structural protein-like n=1 Tax=Bactrocera tryoni TaxID=59916 RepID=UPI001A96FCDF|nr:glycine-rich cell wall structural protein-like [Bactrocera tryoni]
MRFCIIFALIVAIYADADKASEQSMVAAVKALPTEEQRAVAGAEVQPNSLLEDVDAGGEHAEEAERAARSFGWGGYGGYGGFGGFGGYGYKRWGGYGGYGGHRGYGGYGYRPHYAVVYRQPYYHGYGHKYWG